MFFFSHASSSFPCALSRLRDTALLQRVVIPRVRQLRRPAAPRRAQAPPNGKIQSRSSQDPAKIQLVDAGAAPSDAATFLPPLPLREPQSKPRDSVRRTGSLLLRLRKRRRPREGERKGKERDREGEEKRR